MLHIFRDDLEKIEYIFLHELKAEGFIISTSDYEYQSVKEIPSDSLPTSFLSIKSYKPYLSIELNKDNASLYASENTLVVAGAFNELASVLKNRQRVYWHIIMKSFPLYSIPFAILTWIVPRNFIHQSPFPLIWAVLLLLYIYGSFFSFKATTRHYTVVEFVNESARPNFMERNKDQISVGLITGIIGAIVGVGLTIIAYQYMLLK